MYNLSTHQIFCVLIYYIILPALWLTATHLSTFFIVSELDMFTSSDHLFDQYEPIVVLSVSVIGGGRMTAMTYPDIYHSNSKCYFAVDIIQEESPDEYKLRCPSSA